MPIDDAELSLTKEPSGEIRLRLWLPDKHGCRAKRQSPIAAQAAGGSALVYRRKVREKSKDRAGFGGLPYPSEFGRRAKRAVKNACGALEQEFGRRVVFATVTLPGSTKQARELLARWSAKAVELLTHWITSKAEGAYYVYVWEWQKNGALHLHCAIGHHDVLRLRALEQGFKQYIHKMFSTLSRLAGADLFGRAEGGSWRGCVQVLRSNCVPVRKSVKRYMSKYISKGAGVAQGYSPSRWWGCSRALRALCGALRRCIRRRISVWAEATKISTGCRQLIAQAGYKSFYFEPPYSPSSHTVLIYPDDPHIDSFFALLTDVVTSARVTPVVTGGECSTGLPIQRYWEPTR